MTLTLLIFLLLLACLFGRLKWRHWSRASYGSALLLFLLVGCGPLPALLLSELQTPYATRPALDWGERNAIVLLTAGAVYVPKVAVEPSLNAFGRITEAAMLYRQCRQSGASCTVLVTGGDPTRYGTSLALTYGADLQRLGVPPADLVLETHSLNTWQNAQFSRPLLQAISAQRVWLVTSGFHLRRSMLYFAGSGIRAIPVRADYLRTTITFRPRAENFALTDVALHEYLGIARFHVYRAMGWSVSEGVEQGLSPGVDTPDAAHPAPVEGLPAATLPHDTP